MRRITIMAGLALVMAGCEGSAPESANKAESVGPGAVENEMRRCRKASATRSSFAPSRTPDGTVSMSNRRHRPASIRASRYGRAHCSDGGNWTIVITNGGTAVVLDADERRLVDDNEAAPQNGQGQ
jgi:hypothetical protein